MEQALLNIRTVLETAGGTAQDLTRLTWYITDKRDYAAKQKQVGDVYRKILGNTFPAMTMVVVTGLIEDKALVEIEATAVIEL
jgi:enamine deaminase RidA (YjgF/YER057c/UK114 family)